MTGEAGTRFRIAEAVRSRRIADETVLVDLERGVYYALDEVGTEIWDGLSEGDDTPEALKLRILRRFEVDAERAATDLDRLLGELERTGLIVSF